MRVPRAVEHALRDERGAVAMMFALCMTMLFGCLALAVDLNRAYSARAKLAEILDAASLAGAKMLDLDYVTDAQIAQRVKSFVAAQPPILGIPAAQFAKLTIQIDRAKNTVGVTGKGKLPTAVAKVIGFATLDINQTATTTYKMKDVELSLVMDNTGSMADVPAGDTVPKITSLISAATDVVNTLYAQSINERGIRVAIAPFSSAVNAGSYAAQSVNQSGAQSLYFQAYTGPQNFSTCAVERLGSSNATDASPSSGGLLRSLTQVGGANNACPTAAIMPLSGKSQQANILSTIASFTPGGSTAGHLGFAWGWYLLSPNWSSIFSSNQPGAYGDANLSKHLVLMTDGLFNTSYLTGLPAGSAAAISESYSQFQALCKGAKAKGITVYTIGFGLTDPTALNELSKCATGTEQFFAASTGADLKNAFGKIVAKLNSLRISK